MVKNNDDIGCSIDLGTGTIVAARMSGKNVKTTRVRNAFLDLPPESKRMLKLSNTSYAELDGKLLVIGDEALQTANLFNREARRPMSRGILASGEIDAQQVMSLMMKKALGDPHIENEKCCFCVPAPALDVAGSDITYHTAILKKILTELGYDAEAANEAFAVVLSECAEENFCGIGLSYGAGMSNICLSYNSMSALEFSVARGGDFVDNGAAKAVNTTAAKICAVKEGGVNIMNPKSREEEAIALYLQTLIDYSISSIIQHFHKVKSEILIPKPIPIVVSGGTSLAGGFLDKFKAQFETFRAKFPVQISEIRAARDPMTAVAQGLLVLARMEA